MRKLSLYLFLLLTAALSSCSQKLLVTSHLNCNSEIRLVTTFSWSPFQENYSVDSTESANYINTQLIQNTIEKELISRGFRKVESNAEMRIEFMVNVEEKRTVITSPLPYIDNFDEEYRVKTEQFKKASLTIHVENGEGTATWWMGTATGVIIHAPKSTNEIIENTVKEIFQQFPFRKDSIVGETVNSE